MFKHFHTSIILLLYCLLCSGFLMGEHSDGKLSIFSASWFYIFIIIWIFIHLFKFGFQSGPLTLKYASGWSNPLYQIMPYFPLHLNLLKERENLWRLLPDFTSLNCIINMIGLAMCQLALMVGLSLRLHRTCSLDRKT